jgi:hypothetical protein
MSIEDCFVRAKCVLKRGDGGLRNRVYKYLGSAQSMIYICSLRA